MIQVKNLEGGTASSSACRRAIASTTTRPRQCHRDRQAIKHQGRDRREAVQRAGDDWKGFVETLGNLRYSEWPVDLEHACLWYEPHLDRIHEDAETRRADLLQLEQIASGYCTREHFLTELTLDPPDATSDQAGVPLLDEDYLILSTIHSAKRQGKARRLQGTATDGA